jgi:hypothetical protein
MAVADKLACGKNGRHEFGPVNDGIKTLLKKADQIFRRIALQACGFGIDSAKLTLGDIAVISFEFLFGAELDTIIRWLSAAALPMLSRSIFALIDGAFRPAPNIFAMPAVDLIFGANALGHVCLQKKKDLTK